MLLLCYLRPPKKMIALNCLCFLTRLRLKEKLENIKHVYTKSWYKYMITKRQRRVLNIRLLFDQRGKLLTLVIVLCTKSVSAAFAPYRVRPYLIPCSPHTFRVRPNQVEFAPWLSDIQMSWFVSWWVNSSVLMNGYKSNNLSNAAAMKAWFASSQVWLLRSTHFAFVR